MPATSIRDLVIKDDDIVVGTHGRSFWILDNVTVLRQLERDWGMGDSGLREQQPQVRRPSPDPQSRLFKPQTATRIRYSQWPDTPLPPDEPAAENPPDGAIIDYIIGTGGAGSQPVTLEIYDGASLVRRYASTDTAMAPADIGNVPKYWIRPTRVLSAAARHASVRLGPPVPRAPRPQRPVPHLGHA